MPRGEGIKPLHNLFEKYKKTLQAPQGSVITACIEVLDDLYSLQIPKKYISYTPHNKILTIRASGPMKTEILLKKKEILTHLKGRLGEKSAPKDIL